MSTANVGNLILSITLGFFIYHVLFCIQPFFRLEEDNYFYSIFPPLKFAFLIPSIFGILFCGSLILFTLYQFGDNLLRKTSSTVIKDD